MRDGILSWEQIRAINDVIDSSKSGTERALGAVVACCKGEHGRAAQAVAIAVAEIAGASLLAMLCTLPL